MKMSENKLMVIREVGEKFTLEVLNKRSDIGVTTCLDLSYETGLSVDEIKELTVKNNGEIFEVEVNTFGFYSKYDLNVLESIIFVNKEDCENVLNIFNFERKINEVFKKVKVLEKQYNSKENRTKEDIKMCYDDKYILEIWEIEKYTEEKGEGFATFESFLIDFIEQNLIFE